MGLGRVLVFVLSRNAVVWMVCWLAELNYSLTLTYCRSLANVVNLDGNLGQEACVVHRWMWVDSVWLILQVWLDVKKSRSLCCEWTLCVVDIAGLAWCKEVCIISAPWWVVCDVFMHPPNVVWPDALCLLAACLYMSPLRSLLTWHVKKNTGHIFTKLAALTHFRTVMNAEAQILEFWQRFRNSSRQSLAYCTRW